MSRKITPWLQFAVALPLLWLAFSFNAFGTADSEWFRGHQRGPEGQIAGRMAVARRHGFWTHAGLNGECTTLDRKFHHQDEIYLNDMLCVVYVPYASQVGFQALTASAIDWVSPFERDTTWQLLHLATAFFSAAFVALFLVWLGREFGPFAFALALLTSLASPWMTVYGRNLYWMMGVFYLPLLTVIWTLGREQQGRAITRVGVTAAITGAVLVKCLFNGYEFMTTTLVMMMVPLVYVAFSERWAPRRFATTGLWYSGAALLGVLISMFILVGQIASLKGGVADGIGHIKERFERRSHGNADQHKGGGYRASLEAPTVDVVASYLNGTAFGHRRPFDGQRPESLSPKGRFTYRDFIGLVILASLVGSLVAWRLRTRGERDARLEGLLVCTGFALLAPLSWFVIFKAHSYIHTHVNFLTWHLPFVPIASALLGYLIGMGFDSQARGKLVAPIGDR